MRRHFAGFNPLKKNILPVTYDKKFYEWFLHKLTFWQRASVWFMSEKGPAMVNFMFFHGYLADRNPSFIRVENKYFYVCSVQKKSLNPR